MSHRLLLLCAAALLAAFPGAARAAQPPAPEPDLTAPLLRAAPTPPTTLPTLWACHPDRVPNPCTDDGPTTVLRSAQLQPRKVERIEPVPVPGEQPPIDCFYAYPTVTTAPGTNARRAMERSLDALLRWQVARFSRVCRVFAPIHRQVTPIVGIGGSMARGETVTSPAQNLAFSDLLGAWRDYMANDNRGRGVLFIGHSQGSALLTRLIERDVDRSAAARKQLVGAFLIGGNIAVKPGKRLGGTFAYLPTCSQPGEYGCVVAYSIFGSPPGGTALFGRLSAISRAFGSVWNSDYQPACTNPAELAGDDRLRPILRSVRPPGSEGDTDLRFWNYVRP
ncbi:MAG: DUF3089 domain-containing protein, partial [Solirubrobacteraceae bacterium]|nr:DUF3089 domain-containing protein [Solirubrobacteraceae bacterium]